MEIIANGQFDLAANSLTGIELTESNLISEYLANRYDTKGIFAVEGEQNKLLVKQWLGFQAASQGPFFAQVNIMLVYAQL